MTDLIEPRQLVMELSQAPPPVAELATLTNVAGGAAAPGGDHSPARPLDNIMQQQPPPDSQWRETVRSTVIEERQNVHWPSTLLPAQAQINLPTAAAPIASLPQRDALCEGAWRSAVYSIA